MGKTGKLIMKIAAVIAMLGLIISSFSFAFRAGAQEVLNPNATFVNRDMTVGSSGPEVTALQNFLIKGGFDIKAGATGYFGGQTQAALARYQASVGIHPAAGYFGPLTRAKVKDKVEVVTDHNTDDLGDDADKDEFTAKVVIRDGKATVTTTQNGEEDRYTLNTTSHSKIIAEVAKRLHVPVADVRDAIVIATVREETKSTSSANTAKVNDRDGADNDTATFKIVAKITAIGNDIYIDRDPATSFNYEIQDAQGNEITSATSQSEVLTSTADEDGGYYVVREGDQEVFTLTVSFDPIAADEGQFFRAQLIEVLYNDEAASPDRDWNASPQSKYRTPYVNITD